jgi:hypothetical protein
MIDKPQGFLGRSWKKIQRLLLGRADPSYLGGLVGGERFFDEAIAAQLGWPGVKSQGVNTSSDPDKASLPAGNPPVRPASNTVTHRDKPAA